jgi:hypothetical protein
MRPMLYEYYHARRQRLQLWTNGPALAFSPGPSHGIAGISDRTLIAPESVKFGLRGVIHEEISAITSVSPRCQYLDISTLVKKDG